MLGDGIGSLPSSFQRERILLNYNASGYLICLLFSRNVLNTIFPEVPDFDPISVPVSSVCRMMNWSNKFLDFIM